MVHYIALFRIGENTTDEEMEEMIRTSRSCFHRVNEAHNFRSGRSLDRKSDFGFFISADFESREKMAMFLEDPNYERFDTEVIQAHTVEQVVHSFETEPGKDPKYS